LLALSIVNGICCEGRREGMIVGEGARERRITSNISLNIIF